MDLSKFCKTLSDSEHPGRCRATQRFHCNQVFCGTVTDQGVIKVNLMFFKRSALITCHGIAEQ